MPIIVETNYFFEGTKVCKDVMLNNRFLSCEVITPNLDLTCENINTFTC